MKPQKRLMLQRLLQVIRRYKVFNKSICPVCCKAFIDEHATISHIRGKGKLLDNAHKLLKNDPDLFEVMEVMEL